MGKVKRSVLDKHYAREGDSGYFNFHQVEQKVNNYYSLMTGFSDTTSELNQNVIKELEDLLQILINQENKFYNMYGITANNITSFHNRIEKWRTSMAHLLSKETAQEICNIMASTITNEDVASALNNYFDPQKNTQDQIVDAQVLYNHGLSDILNDAFFIDEKGKKKKGGFSKTLDKQFSANFQVVSNGKGGYSVETLAGQNKELTNYMKLKIVRTVNKAVKDEYKITTAVSDEIQKEIYNVLTKNNNVDAEMKLCLSNELIGRKMEYTKFPHLPVIQGWLGEMYWNAAFSYISGQRRVSIPSGAMQNTQGKQLSVDIIYNNIGFQVKNWSFDNKSEHHNIKKMNFGNFIGDRADLLNVYTGQVIAQLFGAVSYNRPTTDISLQSDRFSEYNSLYADAEALTTKLDFLTNVFYTRLNKIIGIDSGNTLKDQNIDGKRTFYNTFWLLKDKIVPSSVIIQQLIDDIKLQSYDMDNKPVQFRILGLTEKQKPTEQSVWPYEANFTDRAMANRWEIQYEYIFNLERLLSQVYTKIN